VEGQCLSYIHLPGGFDICLINDNDYSSCLGFAHDNLYFGSRTRTRMSNPSSGAGAGAPELRRVRWEECKLYFNSGAGAGAPDPEIQFAFLPKSKSPS